MTIYCEDAAAAEILFSLTGGREGRVFSYNPPVKISTGHGFLYLLLLRYPASNEDIAKLVFKSYFLADGHSYLTRANDTYINGDVSSHSCEIYYNENSIDTPILSVSAPPYTYIDENTRVRNGCYLYKNKEYKNAFCIEDTSGIIYLHEYPEGLTPIYQVNCISCPPGLYPIKKEEDKIACIDSPKVINNLNNASKKIDSIYG